LRCRFAPAIRFYVAGRFEILRQRDIYVREIVGRREPWPSFRFDNGSAKTDEALSIGRALLQCVLALRNDRRQYEPDRGLVRALEFSWPTQTNVEKKQQTLRATRTGVFLVPSFMSFSLENNRSAEVPEVGPTPTFTEQQTAEAQHARTPVRIELLNLFLDSHWKRHPRAVK
jgi:hypothetical protein